MKAIIFDMDGVIADSFKLHIKVQTQLSKKHKLYSTLINDLVGVKVNEVFKKLAKEKKRKLSEKQVKELTEEYWEIVNSKISSIKPMLNIKPLMIKLKDNGFRLAIASSSKKKYVHSLLNNFKIRSFFEVIITGDQVKKGKPNPEIFLLAARRLNALPEECIVVEDSVSGMKAAKKAKMKCVAVGDVKKIDSKLYNLIIDVPKKLNIKELNDLV